jgi:hypothetical protein
MSKVKKHDKHSSLFILLAYNSLQMLNILLFVSIDIYPLQKLIGFKHY